MNSIDILQGTLKNDQEMFLARLSTFAILDIGTIVSVKEGRALVHGSSFIGGKQVVYQDAEIIFPGNIAGAYTADCAGTACLIFIPCSCMPDTVSKDVHIAALPYDRAGVKVMPIGNGFGAPVRTNLDSFGSFNISTAKYSISCKEDAIHIERNDAKASLSLDEDGGLHIIKQGDNGTFYCDVVDGSVETTWQSKDKDVQWVDTFNTDGSRSSVQNNPQDEDADPLFSLTVDKEGAVIFNTAKAFTFETQDALTLKGKTVAIESTDGVTTMKSSDNIDVTSGSGKKFTVNGTNLEVE